MDNVDENRENSKSPPELKARPNEYSTMKHLGETVEVDLDDDEN